MPRVACPVCGRFFRGNLKDHLDAVVNGSDGVSRCDWNLTEERIMLHRQSIIDRGWVQAGSTAARIVSWLRYTHPHLAWLACSGGVHVRVHISSLVPANDLKVWWTRRWCKAIASCAAWPMLSRAQLLREVDLQPKIQQVIEATYLVGGTGSVEHMVRASDWARRCRDDAEVQLEHADNKGRTLITDWCVLQFGHAGNHMGARTLTRW